MLMVVGGAGYIGSHFVRRYCSRFPQKPVLVVDNLSEGHVEALDGLSQVTLVQADIADTAQMQSLIEQHQITAVVHFAASCYVGESSKDPVKYFKNNVAGTLSLLEAMEKTGLRRLVFSSTCATYGHPVQVPMDESHPQAPINVYGVTKLMVEQVLRQYHAHLGWSYVALRYFNAAGADPEGFIGESHNPETHLIPLILQTALGKRPSIDVFGTDYDTPDGTCIRDYIHVYDLADAHIAALELMENSSNPVGEAINLGTTLGASVKEMIEQSEKLTGLPIAVNYSARREGDPPRLVANAAKAKALLGWQTQYSLGDILTSAWQWEQKRRY